MNQIVPQIVHGSRLAALAGAVAVLWISSSIAQATLLVPGGSVGENTPASPGTLDVFADTPVLLDSVSTFVSTPTYSGTLTAAVYQNDGGTLDFYYQFSNDPTSSDGIERLTNTSFTGYTTDVGYRTTAIGPFTDAGTQAPLWANRSANGSVVGFHFVSSVTAPPYQIDPGESSHIVVVRTNATQYFEGNTAIIDGFAANAPSFAPSLIPEPASLGAIALTGAMLLRRRSR